tara:strand:+ start:124 stop:498 length:375 start_codon:yes stop_codon:yes gene_type:complete
MKKDLDYVAAVEKAIADKYGKNTVQDFRNSWDTEKEKEYLKQIKDVSKKQKKAQRKRKQESRTCPVCKTYSFSSKDDLYMNRFKCCYDCYVEYISPSANHCKKWKDGWRPTEQEIQERLLLRRK